MSFPYPSEPTTIRDYSQRVMALYAEAGLPFPENADADAFVWLTRFGYSSSQMPAPQAEAKHLAELRSALGLNPPQPPVNLLPITIEREYFCTSEGPIFVKGATAFHWFELFVKGDGLLETLIADQAGFDEGRVLLTYSGTLGHFDGRQHADQLEPFADFLASRGKRLEPCCWADTQRFPGITNAEQLRWVREVDDRIGHKPHVAIEGVNEDNVHDNDAPGLEVPTPIRNPLASHGAARTIPRDEDTGAEGNWSTAQPVWKVACVHTERDSEWMRKVGHNAAEAGWHFKVAARNNEIKRPDQYGYRTNEVFEAAAGAAIFLSSATFHCASMRDNKVMADQERACAQAWLAGLAAIPVDYRYGDYANAHSSRAPIEHKDEWSIATHSRIRGDKAVSVVYQRNSKWKPVSKGDWRVVSVNQGVVFSER